MRVVRCSMKQGLPFDSSWFSKITFSNDYWLSSIIPKSNWNIVLVSSVYRRTKLTEVDMNGSVLRQYKSSLNADRCVCQADKYGRMLITNQWNKMELLDSEYNLIDFTGLQMVGGCFSGTPFEEHRKLHYNSERNEILTVVFDRNSPNGVLTIFHLKEI